MFSRLATVLQELSGEEEPDGDSQVRERHRNYNEFITKSLFFKLSGLGQPTQKKIIFEIKKDKKTFLLVHSAMICEYIMDR